MKCPYCSEEINDVSNTKIHYRGTSYWGFLLRLITIFLLIIVLLVWIWEAYGSKTLATKQYWENSIMVWLNEKYGEDKCKSVSLVQKSLNEYTGFAEFESSRNSNVRVTYDLWDGQGIMSAEPLLTPNF